MERGGGGASPGLAKKEIAFAVTGDEGTQEAVLTAGSNGDMAGAISKVVEGEAAPASAENVSESAIQKRVEETVEEATLPASDTGGGAAPVSEGELEATKGKDDQPADTLTAEADANEASADAEDATLAVPANGDASRPDTPPLDPPTEDVEMDKTEVASGGPDPAVPAENESGTDVAGAEDSAGEESKQDDGAQTEMMDIDTEPTSATATTTAKETATETGTEDASKELAMEETGAEIVGDPAKEDNAAGENIGVGDGA